MPATAFIEPSGYQYIVNESINLLRAAVSPYTQYVNGLPWVLASAAIIFLVPGYVYIKSQNSLASGFSMLLITLVMKHYSVYTGWMPLNPFIEYASYGISAIFIVGALYVYTKT